MNTQHPVLQELLEICSEQNINPGRAYITFQAFLNFLLDEKSTDVSYHFDESLKMFYLQVTKENDTGLEIQSCIPISFTDKFSFKEISTRQEKISLQKNNVQFIIIDEDSSTTCYKISKGLVKPDSPSVCKIKKDVEERKYQMLKHLKNNRKILYSKALNNLKKKAN